MCGQAVTVLSHWTQCLAMGFLWILIKTPEIQSFPLNKSIKDNSKLEAIYTKKKIVNFPDIISKKLLEGSNHV